MATKKIMAGSELIATLSMVFKKRAIAPLGACTSLLLFIFEFPRKISCLPYRIRVKNFKLTKLSDLGN